MKVYTVHEGAYSDRTLMGIFSTKELAEEFIQRRKSINRYSARKMDIEPDEWELDLEMIQCCNVSFIDGIWRVTGPTEGDAPLIDEWDIYPTAEKGYAIRVHYDDDKERMIKAAQDIFATWKAEQAGIC